ncbi:hypothetical protein ACYX7F_01970 [Sphingobacterium hungaricum]
MNRQLLLFCIFIGAFTLSKAQTQDLSEYFLRSLQTSEVYGNKIPKKNIKIKDLEDSRKSVWSAWKEANSNFQEIKLPAILPLSDSIAYEWPLVDEDPMPFYYGSKGKKPANGYPLFINIHGSGPKEKEWAATIAWSKIYADAPSLYYIPRIPNEKRYRWWFIPEQKAWEKLFRLAFLNDDINPNKMYFVGISEGGYGSQRLGAFYADYLAGAGPMAGGEPLVNTPPLNFRNTAFNLQTGEKDFMFDRNKITKQVKTIFDSLSNAYPGKFIHQVDLQKGKGHAIDYTLTTPWLIQHTRITNPREVSWVNFPMHDRYRTGFYNLAIKEQVNIDKTTDIDRALFEFAIDSTTNSIRMNANTLNKITNEKGAITKGKLLFYLDENLVDLNKKVTLYVNEKKVFSGKVKLDSKNIIESCALFYDSNRLYPASIEIDFSKL